MKRSKRIFILLGVFVVACIATFAVLRHEEHKEKIKNSDEIILQIPTDSVKTLFWKNETTELSFHKSDKWLYDEDEAFPVDEEKINEFLKQFEEFGAAFIIEEVEDLGQYGLDDPICTIKIATEEKSYEILLGDFSTMDSQRYVSIGDGNVYLVKNDPYDNFDAELKDVIDHDETPKFDTVSEIQFEGTENYKVVYEEESPNTYCDDDIYFTERDGKTVPLDTNRVKSYLRNITNLDLTDYVTYNVSDEELKTYGLDNPELTVVVYYTVKNDDDKETEETFVLNVSRDPEEKKKAEEKAKKETENKDESEESTKEEQITAYVRVGESQKVYKITSDDYKDLMAASYDSLRHLEVLSADFDDINQIDITLEDTQYTITTKKKDDEITYYYNGEELKIDDVKNAIGKLNADSFTDEQPTKKLEIALAVHLDNKNFPQVKIELYRYNGTHCLAVVDGEPVSLVKRSNVVDLMEAIYAFVLN